MEMEIKKGTLLNVNNVRSGKWVGVATRDFNTDTITFYPIALAQQEPVDGLTTKAKWVEGDDMPCRNSLCKISIHK
jgi:hypothetical protein